MANPEESILLSRVGEGTTDDVTAPKPKRSWDPRSWSWRYSEAAPAQLQAAVLGSVVGLTLCEAWAHGVMMRSAAAGEIPKYVNDVFFVATSLLGVLLYPALAWAGRGRCARTIALWLVAAAAAAVPVAFVPMEAADSSDLCLVSAPAPPGPSPRAGLRLALLVAMGLAAHLAAVAVWTHGLAALYVMRPDDIAKDYGSVLGARVFIMVMCRGMLAGIMDKSSWIQLLALTAPFAVKLIMLSRMPAENEEGGELDDEKEGGGFLASVNRVLSDRRSTAHLLSAGLAAAAVWGFTVHDAAFTRAKYLLVEDLSEGAVSLSKMVGLLSLNLMAFLLGYQLSPPRLPTFSPRVALAKASWLAALAALAVLAMLLLGCSAGRVSAPDAPGARPGCSLACGCDLRTTPFAPVCHAETMTTFYSPCHAGCTAREIVNGVTVLSNCGCVGWGRALVGACSLAECARVHGAHRVLSTVLVVLGVCSVVVHALVALRAAARADAAAAVAVSASVVTLLAFVVGHLGYMAIDHFTCAVFTQGECQLHSPAFVVTIGCVSIALIVSSFVINMVLRTKYKDD